MTQGNLHVHSPNGHSCTQLHKQTRSKHGLTLRQGYVVLAVITSGPLRLPYALNSTLRSLSRLYAAYHCRNTVGTQGSQVQHSYSFTSFKRPYPGFSTGACALCFPVNYGLLHKHRRSACILSNSSSTVEKLKINDYSQLKAAKNLLAPHPCHFPKIRIKVRGLQREQQFSLPGISCHILLCTHFAQLPSSLYHL